MSEFLGTRPKWNDKTLALLEESLGAPISIPYTFNGTSFNPLSNPGSGQVHLDNSVQGSTTIVSISTTSNQGDDWNDVINSFGDGTSVLKGYLRITSLTDPANWILFKVNSITLEAGWTNINVSFFASGGDISDGDSIFIYFSPTGDKGDSVTSPTGTGFTHVTSDVQDGVAKLVEIADVAASLKPSGTATVTDESLRALGIVAGTAAAGDDFRLSFPKLFYETQNIAITGAIGIAWSHNGAWVAVTSEFLDICTIISTTDWSTVTSFSTTGNSAYGMAFSPDDSKLAIVHENSNSIVIFNTSTWAVAHTITGYSGSAALALDWSLDGSWIAIGVAGIPGKVHFLSTSSWTITHSINIGSGFTYPFGIAFSPDSSLLATAENFTGTAYLISTSSWTVVHTIASTSTSPQYLSYAPNGGRIAIASQGATTIGIVETTGWTVEKTIDVGGTPTATSFTSDSRYIIVAMEDGIVFVDSVTWDISGKLGKSSLIVKTSFDGTLIAASTQGLNTLDIFRINPENIAYRTHLATSKTTPLDADELPLVDTASNNIIKKLTGTNLKAYLKTYFDTLYLGISATAAAATKLVTARAIDGQNFDGTASITVIAPGTHAASSKTTPLDADEIPLVDTAASNVLKKLTGTNLKAYLKTYFDTLYPSGSGTSSGTNTGDQTTVSGNAGTATILQTSRNIDGQTFNGSADITVIAPGTHAATSKSTPVDADEIPIVDSAASNILKKLTFSNLKATLKTYFDTIYAPVSSGFTRVRVGSQQDITTAGFVNITNMSFSVVNGHVYKFEAFIPYRSSSTSMGVLFAYNGPAMANTVILSEKTITTPGTASTDMLSSAILTANDTPNPSSTAEPIANADLVWRVQGTFIPSADGTFALRMSKENVAGTASAMPSGWMEYADIT